MAGPKSNSGFTLVEMMVTFAIVAIGLDVAVPSFTAMIERNRSATEVNEFLVAINLARSEALKIGGTVSIQATDPDEDNEFGAGWCVVRGNPGNCTGTLVRRFPALIGSGTTLNSFEDKSSIQFNFLGELEDGAVQNIDFCSEQRQRRIFISLIGRSKSHRPDDAAAVKQPSCS
jgi:type IV fimbrial biogenesis protein FimT